MEMILSNPNSLSRRVGKPLDLVGHNKLLIAIAGEVLKCVWGSAYGSEADSLKMRR